MPVFEIHDMLCNPEGARGAPASSGRGGRQTTVRFAMYSVGTAVPIFELCKSALYQRDPEVFLGGLGYQGQETTHFTGNKCFCWP